MPPAVRIFRLGDRTYLEETLIHGFVNILQIVLMHGSIENVDQTMNQYFLEIRLMHSAGSMGVLPFRGVQLERDHVIYLAK